MYCRNKKEYHLGTAYTNKITTASTFTFVLIAVIVSPVAVVTTASISMHKVSAQMNNSSNMAGNMKGSGGKSNMGNEYEF